MFCKKGVLENFTKFTGKHLCQSLFFNKVAGLRSATLLKKRLWYRCFPVNFVKYLRPHFFYRTSSVAASVIAPAQRRQQHSMSLQKSRLILKDNRADSRIKLKQSKFIAVRGELKIKYKSLFSKDFISACSYFYLVLKLVLLILVEFYQPFRRDYFWWYLEGPSIQN